MNGLRNVLMVCVLVCLIPDSLTDGRNKTDEEFPYHYPFNASYADFILEAGPPDSHEAMNHHDKSQYIHYNYLQQQRKLHQQKQQQQQQALEAQHRDKRSYEFLMGLINNNSRYEVTRVDPSATVTTKPEVTTDGGSKGMEASELLLEMMVRIAAHPDQWNKVHELLHNLDEDLTTSKYLVDKIKSESTRSEDNKTKPVKIPEKEGNPPGEVSNNHIENMSKKYEQAYDGENKWPFLSKIGNNVQFVNSNSARSTENGNGENQTSQPQEEEKTTAAYHQKFAYHRVTGTPFNLNKDPKAYIAVSVIAPKPVNSVSKENDLTLENELHQLKPWTHSQNLKNMESIRSRWLIQTDENVKTVV